MADRETDWESEVEIRVGLDPAFIEHQSSPEKRLLAAVLGCAIRDAMGVKTLPFESDSLRAEKGILALEWLKIDQTIFEEELMHPIPFSFIWVAQHLDCDPLQLRDNIKLRLEDGGLKGAVIHRNESK